MFKLKPKKKEEPAPVYKFVPLKPNPALALAPLNASTNAHKVPKADQSISIIMISKNQYCLCTIIL